MAAGVNVALCPWLLYRSYICPVREPRHFTPAKSTGRPKRPLPDSFSTSTSRLSVGPPRPCPSLTLSYYNLYAWQDAVSRSRLITLFCVMPSNLYACVCDFLLELYFCRSGYESSMTTGPRTIDATMDYLQTCLIFYLLILCFCGGRSIDICK